jgi:hypothetical protein
MPLTRPAVSSHRTSAAIGDVPSPSVFAASTTVSSCEKVISAAPPRLLAPVGDGGQLAALPEKARAQIQGGAATPPAPSSPSYFYGFLGGGASQWDPCLAENPQPFRQRSNGPAGPCCRRVSGATCRTPACCTRCPGGCGQWRAIPWKGGRVPRGDRPRTHRPSRRRRCGCSARSAARPGSGSTAP